MKTGVLNELLNDISCKLSLPLKDEGNLIKYEPVTHPMYRHTGYTSTYYADSDEFKTTDGENVCIYKYENILPEGKKLMNVKLVQSKKFDTDIFLLKLEGVK